MNVNFDKNDVPDEENQENVENVKNFGIKSNLKNIQKSFAR